MVRSNSKLSHFIRRISDELGWGDPKPESGGICTILFDERIEVTIAPYPYRYSFYRCDSVFHARLGRVPDVPSADQSPEQGLILQAMAANFFWKDTNGATLSLDKESSTLVLMMPIRVESMDYREFFVAFHDFIGNAERWVKIVDAREDREHDRSVPVPPHGAATPYWVAPT